MTPDALVALLDYHYWARDRLLDAVERITPEQFREDLANSFPSIRDTLIHLVSAEWAWYSRWNGESPGQPLPLAGLETVEDIRTRWMQEEGRVRRFVGGLGPDGIKRTFRYTLLDGSPGSSVYGQSVQHVVNHASYHRGQVVTMLRQLGAQPPESQDLAAFYRR
ncbi:DinB family protein [Candidatus Palauibacter sp.]|uniref:DinB family protein n=1 Tax=Candidatus Palauibacter sp. TaxID=3101350 RepID=UPI003AF1EA0C